MLGIGLTGCTVGPDFQSPETREAPRRSALDGGNVPSRTVEVAVDMAWWKSFRDFQLSSLVERLVAQNLDLETAAERVIQSMAQRRVAASQGLPQIDGQSSSTYNRQSPNGTLSLLVPRPGAPLEYPLFRDGLTSSWQLDLFGRVRRAVEAADAATLAAVENRHGVALAAVAELAQGYMQLRGTQNRLGIAKRNLRLAEENVELVNKRFGDGVATTLDLAQARAQQATIAATLARLHEATAQTGVAVASFYPDVTLNGAVGVESLHLTNLFSPTSTAFALGPSISVPIFEGAQLRGTLALRESRQREAAILFQKTVLRAWKEVDDALTAYREVQRRRADVARSVTENQAALQAAKQRYSEGAIDFLNVIASQAQLLQSENDLADSDTQIAIDLVNLYRALGGGWEVADVGYGFDRAPRPKIGTP